MPLPGLAFVVGLLFVLGSCATAPAPAQPQGFLSTYDSLKPAGNQRMTYAAPELRDYQSFVIEPIQFIQPPEGLSRKEREQVAEHFRAQVTELLEKRGLSITTAPGPGVAEIRLAMTGIAESPWWLKRHPTARMTGAGTRGSALEVEIVDSLAGTQLGAAIQASPGNQFDINSASTVAEINAAIDKWADQAARRFDDLRADPGQRPPARAP